MNRLSRPLSVYLCLYTSKFKSLLYASKFKILLYILGVPCCRMALIPRGIVFTWRHVTDRLGRPPWQNDGAEYPDLDCRDPDINLPD